MQQGDTHSVASVSEVRDEIQTISQSRHFAQSKRRIRLLEYLCNIVLLGRQDEIKETTIALEIFDRTVNKYRQFFALPFATNSNYRVPVFFELLEEGKMTLMCREELKTQVYSSPYYYRNYTRVILVYTYFFLDEIGDIKTFSGNKNDLIDMMGKQCDQVEKYMKANKLKYDDKYDLVKIITYYNTLFGT